jgi:hypothetical protein
MPEKKTKKKNKKKKNNVFVTSHCASFGLGIDMALGKR